MCVGKAISECQPLTMLKQIQQVGYITVVYFWIFKQS